MMKFLLAAINAKYIHSNLAVYSLKAFAQYQMPELQIEIGEYTINHQMDQILWDIYRKEPDFIGFSCYIWNISAVLELVRDIAQVLPETEIWLGGPEAFYDAEGLLSRNPEIRGIFCGEGELTFSETAEAYEEWSQSVSDLPDSQSRQDALLHTLEQVRGLVFRRNDGSLCRTGAQRLLNMDELPFVYRDMKNFENRIVYYESSRGCPFSCSYCLSSVEKSVRFRSLELVLKELDFFLEQRVPQVKFVDRTFNCKREHTLGIWQHMMAHDNGITNFHFEISADLLDEEELKLLGQMRPGLVQLEIGVQSVNLQTIREIRRTMDLGRLKQAVARVHAAGNIHQHLDLIAGLPYENLSSFLHSFDEVYRMRPDQLQLGFLKVLKGSFMWENAAQYKLLSRKTPPYEVLSTKWLSYKDVLRLKAMEEMVEVYKNSGQFSYSLDLLEREMDSPSGMFLELADFYERQNLFGRSMARLERYEVFYRFLEERFPWETCGQNPETKQQENRKLLSAFRDRLMLDLYLRENAKSRPSFASDQTRMKMPIREFFQMEAEQPRWLLGYEGYDSRQMAKMAHLEAMEDGSFLLFDYRNREPLNHNGRVMRFLRDETGGWRPVPMWNEAGE